MTLYADPSYGGQAVTLGPGSYSWLPNSGFPNDALSSVKLAPGCSVTLFWDGNFGGKQLVLTADADTMPAGSGWDNAASSIKVVCQVRCGSEAPYGSTSISALHIRCTPQHECIKHH